MKRLNSNVGSTKAALQQRPEVLQAIRVHAAIDITFRMIHNIVNEVITHLVVADCVVRIDFRTILNVLEKNVLQSFAGDIRNNLCANLPKISVQDSLYNRFAAMHPSLLHEAQLE